MTKQCFTRQPNPERGFFMAISLLHRVAHASRKISYSIFAHFSILKANSDMYSIAFSIEKNDFLGV